VFFFDSGFDLDIYLSLRLVDICRTDD